MPTAVPVRTCAIAHAMGEQFDCPPGGCSLAVHLRVAPPEHGACPVEELTGGSPLATAGLNALRRELERPAPYDHPLRRETDRHRRIAAAIVGAPA